MGNVRLLGLGLPGRRPRRIPEPSQRFQNLHQLEPLEDCPTSPHPLPAAGTQLWVHLPDAQHSRLPAAPWSLDEATRNEVLAQYQRIREGFPGTAYAVRAEMGIIAHTSARGLERDNLERSYLVSVTGVDCLDVLNGKRKRIVSIPAGGYYDELFATFYGVCESLYFEQRESFPDGRRNLVRFMRENFPLNSLSSIQDLRMSLLADPPLLDNLPDITPTVRIMSPRPDKARGPRPRFRIETVVGDYRYRQVDLDRIRLSVNGFDLVPFLKVGCRISPNPRLGKPFERLRLEARFPHALAPGHYEAHLVVPTIGNEDAVPGTAELTWSFSVRGNSDQDDEQEGWCDENPDDEP